MVPLYLDHAASTPVDPEVAEAMAACLRDPAAQANPAAEHVPGRHARALVDAARAEVAALVGTAARDVVFTAGATEANNLAVLGAAHWFRRRGRHVVTSLTEHASVREPCRQLEREGWQVTWLAPDGDGVIAPEAVAAALRPDTTLVTLVHANNETGVLQDLAAIGAACRARGVPFHADAAQSAGREPLDLAALPVDALTLSAHKLGGPKGVGALCLCRPGLPRVAPLLYGGEQERGLRPGTVATHQVVGFGRAATLAAVRRAVDAARVRALRDALEARLTALPGVVRNGHPVRRVAHILNVTVQGVEGESLLYGLELAGLAVASGAACAAETGEPSPVLRALGRTDAEAQGSLRLSLGRTTTAADVERAAQDCAAVVTRLRALAPRALTA